MLAAVHVAVTPRRLARRLRGAAAALWRVATGLVTGTHETAIGVLIVLVSVLGAVVTWQATVQSENASDLDRRARQELLLRQQLTSEVERWRAWEQGLHDRYRERVALAAPAASDATRQRAIARSLQYMFWFGAPLDADGRPKYISTYIANEDWQVELAELAPRGLEDSADEARTRRVWLVLVDAGAIFAIFFLSLTLLGWGPRRPFAAVGCAMAAAAFSFGALVLFEFRAPLV